MGLRKMSFEIIQLEEQKEKRIKKSEENLHEVWDAIKRIYPLLKSQKEKRGIKVQKAYLKK